MNNLSKVTLHDKFLKQIGEVSLINNDPYKTLLTYPEAFAVCWRGFWLNRN